MNRAMTSKNGFRCPVRGCNKKRNRLFSMLGLAMHLQDKHPGELEKRLKVKHIYTADGSPG